MSEARFYHNADDRLFAACRLTAAAARRGRKVVVFAPDRMMSGRIDQLLWAAQPLSFVPHVAQHSPLAARTPVVLASSLDDVPHRDVLLNLADALPAGWQTFALLVDVIGRGDEERAAGRQRWQDCRAQGVSPQAQDLETMGKES